MRKLVLIFSLALAIVCLAGALGEDTLPVYEVGDTIEDFTVTVLGGGEVTLSELLTQKDMVLINIWATWCGPCRAEFPFMEEAYEKYSDSVAIVALSCEPTDDMDTLAAFAEEFGLTFCVGRDTPDLATAFGVEGIPTSIVVDRFGTICYIEAGSMPDAESFTFLFDFFIGEDYTESVLLDGLPRRKPDITGATGEELAATLNAEGADLTFTLDEDEYAWPLILTEKDGRSVAATANTSINDSFSAVKTTVDAKAGDALCVTFKLSCELMFDMMKLYVNDELIKAFSGEKDWMSYAYAIEADGEYTFTVRYEKDSVGFAGEDTLWIASIALLSGDDAQKALDANPVYVFDDETQVVLLNEGAKKLTINDPSGLAEEYYGTEFYLGTDTEMFDFEFMISDEYDPEMAFVYFDATNETVPLLDMLGNGRYLWSAPVDTMEETGYPESTAYLYADMEHIYMLTYFADEENVNAFVTDISVDDLGNPIGSWTYADGALPGTNEAAQIGEASAPVAASFVVKYVDQYGDPVPGAVLQVCDDSTCTLFTADEDGLCVFELEPCAWELHTLMVPKGYEGDTQTVTISGLYGGEYEFVLTKK